MIFPYYFAKKISSSKNRKNIVSTLTIRIGQLAIFIGIIISIISISSGVGARKAIKNKLSNFNGHIIVTNYNNTSKFLNEPISLLKQKFYPKFPNTEVEHIQSFSTLGGLVRTEKNFEGIIFKGYGADYQKKYLLNFLIKGRLPNFNKKETSNEIIVSEKIVNKLELKLNSNVIVIFLNKNSKPIYRNFKIIGIYRTDIKDFDDSFIVGDIKHIQRINKWPNYFVGGLEIFTKDIETVNLTKESINETLNYAFSVETIVDKYSLITDWIKLFDTNIIIILTIILIVVITNIVMILLILIIDRTYSIGMLKTFGATNTSIQKIFIFYGITIILPGMIAGNFIGISLLLIQKYFKLIKLNPENYYISDAPVYIHWSYLIGINFGIILISALVLVLPSILVRKISPLEAIRFK